MKIEQIDEISIDRKKAYVKAALQSSIEKRKAATDEKGRTTDKPLLNKANKRGKFASKLDDKMKKDEHKAFMARIKKQYPKK